MANLEHSNIPTESRLVYTVDQAAKALSVGRNTVWRAIAAGELESYKHGGRRRIAHVDLAAYVDSLRRKHGGRT